MVDLTGMRLVPSLDQFQEQELLESLNDKVTNKKLMRKIKDWTYTVSYAIFAELQTRAKKGEKTSINTLHFDAQATKDYFKFILILRILEKHNKPVKEQEENEEKERKIYNVRYFLDDEGKPILIDPIHEPEAKLTRDSQAMFG